MTRLEELRAKLKVRENMRGWSDNVEKLKREIRRLEAMEDVGN